MRIERLTILGIVVCFPYQQSHCFSYEGSGKQRATDANCKHDLVYISDTFPLAPFYRSHIHSIDQSDSFAAKPWKANKLSPIFLPQRASPVHRKETKTTEISRKLNAVFIPLHWTHSEGIRKIILRRELM